MLCFIGTMIYFSVLLLSMSALMAEGELQTSADWVKLIFWPITTAIYILGAVLWILIWVPRKLFKGIYICFCEMKDFFVEMFCSAIKDKY